MKKLKLYLEQIENTVVMRVIEQEGITENLSEHIRPCVIPRFNANKLFIRGNDDYYHHYTGCHVFDSVQEAKDILLKRISWLDKVFAKPVEPKRGDWVKVRNVFEEVCEDRIFITKIEGASAPYVCVYPDCEDNFENDKKFDILLFDLIKPLIKSGYNPETHIYYGEID